ncbi:MAG: polyprenyl synthetase family protein, partial [Eubacteriales bacterium]|nr:polyprenyl synthetase family protein [Eubacteriales bacterium]
QVCDDILDVTGNELLLGKPVGSDEEEEKATYVTLLGLDAAKQTAKDYTDQAYQALEAFDENGFLRDLTESLLTREQ